MERKLRALAGVRKSLQEGSDQLDQVIQKAGQYNPWFTQRQVNTALRNICNHLLDSDELQQWVGSYGLPVNPGHPNNVGLVMAGNIPLVGFHDFLCVWLSGHHSKIKLSDKDAFLLPFILDRILETDPHFQGDWEIVEQLTGFDAVIATGSNNSARYFRAYFGTYPHIIRKNRNAVAVVTGKETIQQLELLAEDIITYFGLGCRNVSKLMVPASYDFQPLLQVFENYPELQEHNRYRNNVDYQYALLIMNLEPHHTNGHILFRPSNSLLSPVATVHYEEYNQDIDLIDRLHRDLEDIQCIISDKALPGLATIPFGRSQYPGLTDYADGVDVMAFLTQLHAHA